MKIENIRVKSILGGLATTVHYPDKETEKLAILCPGYLDSKDYAGLVSLANMLAGEGYTTVRFEPTGTWNSDGEIGYYTVSQYLLNIRSILYHMQHTKKYQQVLLAGHGLGASVALIYSARYGHVHTSRDGYENESSVSSVLAIMPAPLEYFTQDKKWFRKKYSISRRDLPYGGGEVTYTVPYIFALEAQRYDLMEETALLKIPVFIVSGTLDTLVPCKYVSALASICNGVYNEMPGICHDYRLDRNETKFVTEFIRSLLTSYYAR